ncbi:MAG: hypothetical protein K0S65_5022 [Labilithrix sp.]|nr:hypothetical protein [Labilithrix sp.]
MERDERAILTTALERAGLEFAIDERRGFPSASLQWAPKPDLPEKTSFLLDAPAGWLRVTTTLDAPGASVDVRHALGLLYAQTGLGHVHYDAENGLFRISASLQAVEGAPSGAALVATLEHLARLHHKLRTSEGDVRAVANPAPGPGSDEPTLVDAARALGKPISLVEDKNGSFVGGIHEPKSNVQCALRLHTPAPGVFAVDAWRLPPARVKVGAAEIERIDRFNASLAAGAMLLFPDGFLIYRWACPYRWLDISQLESPVVVQVALDAFMRF